ncbi:MAG: hypothetical protein WDZ59_04670 [Pirellulales bacterium]
MANSRVGIWWIGAKGGVASTAIAGLLGLQSGRVGKEGLVSEIPQFQGLDLAPWVRVVIGGHEIRDVSLVDEVRRLHTESRVIDAKLLAECAEPLAAIDRQCGWARFATSAAPSDNWPAAPPKACAGRRGRPSTGFGRTCGASHRPEAQRGDRRQLSFDRAADRSGLAAR